MLVSVQCVALEPARGLLVEFYGHPVTSFQRKPWSEAHAVFRVVLMSPVWKEIKGGEASSSQVQSCRGSRDRPGDPVLACCKGEDDWKTTRGRSSVLRFPPGSHGGQTRVFSPLKVETVEFLTCQWTVYFHF